MQQFLMCANSSAQELDGIPGRMLCWEPAPLENVFYALCIRVLLIAMFKVTCMDSAESWCFFHQVMARISLVLSCKWFC